MEDKKRDFRFLLFGIILSYLSTILFCEFYLGSYVIIAKYLIFSPAPYFVDLQILLYGIDAIRNHVDPYTVVCFPESPYSGAYFLYPIVWGFLSPLTFFTLSNYLYIGIILVIITFLSLYFFVGKISVVESIIYSLLVLSPAVMLCIERGNTDLMIFLLILIPIVSGFSQKVIAFLILTSSMLKLFPIGAIAGLMHRFEIKGKKSVILILSIVLLFAFYLIVMKTNIALVFQKGTRPYTGPSYGLGTIPTSLIALFRPWRWYIRIFYTIIFFSGFTLFYYFIGKKIFNLKFSEGKAGLSYLIGSGVFIASFLMGYNHEYRFVFLLLTIPQMLIWVSEMKQLIYTFILIMIVVFWRNLITLMLNGSYSYFLFIQCLVLIMFYFHISIFWNYIKQNKTQIVSLLHLREKTEHPKNSF